jgi:hypothetical protein
MHHDGGVVSVETGLCRELGISYPVSSVGFGSAAGPELVGKAQNFADGGIVAKAEQLTS